MEEDVVLLKTLVVKEKVIAMEQVMEGKMMVTGDVGEILYAGAITARNLVFTTMKKTIAARGLHLEDLQLEELG